MVSNQVRIPFRYLNQSMQIKVVEKYLNFVNIGIIIFHWPVNEIKYKINQDP